MLKAKKRREKKAERIAEKEKREAVTKPDFHMILIVLMGAFVIFVTVWGVCQSVTIINATSGITEPAVLKIEDNSKNAGKTINVDNLIQKILDNVAFEAELNKLDDSIAEGMVQTAEGTDLQIYMGNGTYADELIVMTARDEITARKNAEAANAHLEETKATFRDYLPEEVNKIEKAVNIRCGCYVIVCVTSDYETAERTINSILKE